MEYQESPASITGSNSCNLYGNNNYRKWMYKFTRFRCCRLLKQLLLSGSKYRCKPTVMELLMLSTTATGTLLWSTSWINRFNNCSNSCNLYGNKLTNASGCTSLQGSGRCCPKTTLPSGSKCCKQLWWNFYVNSIGIYGQFYWAEHWVNQLAHQPFKPGRVNFIR
jgi:hypothetical protein